MTHCGFTGGSAGSILSLLCSEVIKVYLALRFYWGTTFYAARDSKGSITAFINATSLASRNSSIESVVNVNIFGAVLPFFISGESFELGGAVMVVFATGLLSYFTPLITMPLLLSLISSWLASFIFPLYPFVSLLFVSFFYAILGGVPAIELVLSFSKMTVSELTPLEDSSLSK